MAIYLKKFETQADYEAAQSGLILPNVSLIDDTRDVKYKPLRPDTRLVAVYNITDASQSVEVFNPNFGGFTSMEVDGVELPEVTSSYSFDTTGEHTIKFGLDSQADIANAFFSYGMSRGELTSVVIPSNVTSIGYSAFGGCTGLTSITIPNSVTSIDEKAFYHCRSLTSIGSVGSGASVEIPSGVTSIGENAFNGCDVLTSVAIGSGVTSIGDNAFGYCGSLTNITIDSNNNTYDSRDNCNAIIKTSTNTLLRGCQNTVLPNSVTSISDRAFEGCSGLTSIAIPNSVTSIGEGAFWGCSSLTSIDIPNSVTSIDDSAFHYCRGLTSCTIGNSVTSIGDDTFNGCRGLTSIVIPDSVTSIGGGAFEECSSLTSCTIGNSVTSIGEYIFESCSSLASIVSNATTAPTIQIRTFYDIKTGGTLTVPSGSSGYDVWMGTGNYYLGKYNWRKVEK